MCVCLYVCVSVCIHSKHFSKMSLGKTKKNTASNYWAPLHSPNASKKNTQHTGIYILIYIWVLEAPIKVCLLPMWCILKCLR